MTAAVPPHIASLVAAAPTVLVVVPDGVTVQRFLLSGALDRMGDDRRLHFVLPQHGAEAIVAAAGPALPPGSWSAVPPSAAALAALVDEHHPLFAVVPAVLDDALCAAAIDAAGRTSLAVLLLQGGWTDLFTAARQLPEWTFLSAWGPDAADRAIERYGLNPKFVVTLGAPQYDGFVRAGAAAIARVRAAIGAADGDRVLLVAGTGQGADEMALLRTLDRAVATGRLGRCRIVYRPHPRRVPPAGDDGFASEVWSHVVLDPATRGLSEGEARSARVREGRLPAIDTGDMAALLSAVDAVLAPASTVLFEALMVGTRVLMLEMGDAGGVGDAAVAPQAETLRRCSAVRVCTSLERVVRDCVRLLEWTWDDKHLRSRQRLIDRNLAAPAGRYAERLADFCRARVEVRGRKLRLQRTNVRSDTISHIYGARLVTQEYCGAREAPPIPGYWMHGWLPAYHNIDPALIAQHKREGQVDGYDFLAQLAHDKAELPQWVARPDQVEYLRAHGYAHVEAIGLPIVYVAAPAVRPVPGSLLVMPPHSHRSHGPGDSLAEAYADAILAIRSRFEHVWVGISADDLAGRQWADAFRRRDLPVFMTSDPGDPQTLVRLRRILSTFEHVTTNGFGSHIAMAAYCGARTSVYGPFAEFPRDRMQATHAVKMFPALLDAAWELCTEAALRRHYPFLFVAPDEAQPAPEWGAREVGEPWRRSPEELRQLFGWNAA
jgi:hypothetical protein